MDQNLIMITPDFHCEVFIDNVFQTIAKARVDFIITGLSAGKYSLKCICTICDIVIERELNIPEDTKVEISFEDYLFEHPDCVKYQLDFAVFLEWFPKLRDRWAKFNLNCEPIWANECELNIPIYVENGEKEGYVDIFGNEALDYFYIIREGEKYGFASGINNIIRPCIYDYVSLFDYKTLDRELSHLGMVEKFDNDEMSYDDWEKLQAFRQDREEEYPFVLEHDTQITEPYSDGCGVLFLNEKIMHPSKKWGLVNLKKNIQTPIKYTHVHTRGSRFSYFGKIAVDIDGKWGVFDFEKFTEIVNCQYDFIDFRNDQYIRYYQNGLCGLMDPDGYKLTEAVYLQIRELNNGLFRVKQEGKWGFIDTSGQEIVPCTYNEVEDFNGGFAKYFENGFFGFLNQNGIRLTEPTYTDSELLYNGMMMVRKGNKSSIGNDWGLIDNNGEVILEEDYWSIFYEQGHVIGTKKNHGSIYLSSTDLSFEGDDYIFLDAHHIAICNKNKWKLFYTSGKSVLADAFDEIGVISKGSLLYFKSGVRYALYSLINHHYVSAFIYDDLFECDNNRIAVLKNGRWGFIDMDGKEIIPCDFKEIHNWFGHISRLEEGVNIDYDKYGNAVWMPVITIKKIELRK